MKIIKGDKVAFFDVDDTLIMWDIKATEPGELVKIESAKYTRDCLPHKKHMAELKRLKQKGWSIVVWSASGSDWAASAVIALGLSSYVDVVVAKPECYYDGLDINTWLPPTCRKYFFID